MKKIFKKILYSIISAIAFLVIFYLLFVNFYPSFGGDVTEKRKEQYIHSSQFKNGIFHNKKKVFKGEGLGKTLKIAYTFFTTKVKNGRPKQDIKVQKLDSIEVTNYNKQARLIWYGHSAFLLQIQGKNVLLDPMFGKVASPHPWLGESRFNSELPLEVKKLPKIDAIVFSHDHYDHLDYESVMKLKEKTEHFFVPLGVGVHLESWGVSSNKITELDWWQSVNYKDLQFICTPSQHFSGRKLNNRMSTLWASWVVKSDNENLFFSGDGGYSKYFKTIGKKYGPFDIALMECGQYNKMWPMVHMTPEETAQAGVDVKAKKLMPIHWAGFKLAMHSWTDPIERVSVKSKELNLPLITPQIGEKILIKDSLKVYKKWWKSSTLHDL